MFHILPRTGNPTDTFFHEPVYSDKLAVYKDLIGIVLVDRHGILPTSRRPTPSSYMYILLTKVRPADEGQS
jgi:hypothetical protein